MIIPLPGGASIDIGTDNAIVSVDGVTLHTPLALSRLLEFWKNKPTLRALLSDYTDEIQLLENAIWDTITKRLLDNAADAQLDVLGRIVGEPRNGLGDPAYRVRIRVRIRINQSFGTAPDVIAVLRLADPAPFHYVRYGTAAFRIDYDSPPAIAARGQISRFVRESRAAGVRSSVVIPTSATRGARWGTVHSATLNQHVGWGTVHSSATGGLWASQQIA